MDEVTFAVEGEIAVVTICRPAARNAITAAVARGIADAMDALDRRDDLRAGILTGAGGTFCAGMDLKALLTGDTGSAEPRGFGGLVEKPPVKPLIAAVEGYALAGGFELALACDMIVAARDARFGLPEVKRGLVARAGGLLRLPRQLPYRVAMEVALTGAMIDAERLYALGMVNRLVEPGGALAAATELAKAIGENAPLSVAASARIIRESRDWLQDEMFALQSDLAAPIRNSEDAREGAKAFAEKRKPVWRGR